MLPDAYNITAADVALRRWTESTTICPKILHRV